MKLEHLLWAIFLFAALLVVIGGALFLIHHGSEVPDYHIFKGEPRELRGIQGVMHLLQQGHSAGMIQLGILILMVIPAVRLLMYGGCFAIEKERFYSLASLFGFLLLLLSLFNWI